MVVNTHKKEFSYGLCENIIKEIVHMRKYNNLSQSELAIMSGVKQPVIARIEHGTNIPNMSTVIKLLAAFGKTLSIVDMKNVEFEEGVNFGISENMFYSESNMAHLRRGIVALNEGKGEEHESIRTDK